MKKSSFSFVGITLAFCAISFLVGIFLAHEEFNFSSGPSPNLVAERQMPRKIKVEEMADDPSAMPDISPKPEELTFFHTLLKEPKAVPIRKRPGTATAKPPPKGEDAFVREVRGMEREDKTAPPSTHREKIKYKAKEKAEEKKSPAVQVKKRQGGKYRIQIASFALRIEAEEMRKGLAAGGHADSYVKVAELPGRGTWYRVYVGEYGTRKEALKAEKILRSKEDLATLIVKDRD